MDEEVKTEKEEKATADVNSTDGDTPEEASPIEQANAAAKRMEAANVKTAELLNKQQELEAKRILGGRTEAGKIEKEPEESPTDYSKRVLKGDFNEVLKE